MGTPTRNEINVYDSLDERAPWCMDFLGKTLEEAEELFRRAPLYYQEGLMWMGPVAFRFYVRAAIAYAASEHATGDADIISYLAMIFSFWQEHQPAELIPCARLLADFCGTVVRHFDRYDADPEIYVGLREQYRHLAEIFARIADISCTA